MYSHFLNRKETTEILSNGIIRALRPYANPEFTYMMINKKDPSQLFVISSYPEEWKHIYCSNNLQQVDPVVLTALKRISPFCWDENLTLISDLKSTGFFSLSKKFNIVNGYTFVLHDYMNNLAMLSLIIHQNAALNIEELVRENQNALQMVLIKTTEKLHSLGNNPSASMSDGQIKHSQRDMFSSRENEVLYWASMGKTYSEIATIISVSSRTVKFHMSNVVKKLGVLNAKQAIRLGVELGLIKSVRG